MKPKAVSAVVATILTAVVIVIVVIFTRGSNNSANPSGKLKIEGFNSEGICAAIMPACGYCPGEEINGNCYLTQAEFDTYKENYSDLKATR